jgi:hypothetical protein
VFEIIDDDWVKVNGRVVYMPHAYTRQNYRLRANAVGRVGRKSAEKIGGGFQGSSPDLVPSVTCPRCGWTSYHPKDVAEGYCSACHDWTGATPTVPVA